MNLGDFEKTTQSGLYLSKEEHPTYGKKYIARFQHDRKRYVKVLGFTKKDNLTKKNAIELLEAFKNSFTLSSVLLIILWILFSQWDKLISKSKLSAKTDKPLEQINL